MTSDRADTTAESTTQTPRRGISKSDEQPWARTERVARSHPIPPVRRFSASDGTRQGTASFQPPVLLDGTPSTSNQQGDKKEVGSFGFPTPIIPHDRHPDSVRSGDEAAFDASRHIPPNSRNGESRRDNQDYRCKVFPL